MIKQGESLFYMGRLLKKEIFGLGAEEVVEDLSGFEFYLSLQTKDSEQLRLQGVKYGGYFTFEVDNTQSLSGNYNIEVGVMVEGKVLVCNKNKSLYVKKSILAQSLSSLEGTTDNSELTATSDTSTIITQSSDDSGQEMSKFLYRIELVESGSAINLNAWSDSSSIDAYLGLILKGEKGEAGEAQFTITMDGVSYQSSGGKVTLPYITCDSVPIEGSQRAVTSDGIYSADEAIREDISWIKDTVLPLKADKSDVYTKDEVEQNFVVLDGYVAYQETEKIKLAGIERGAQVNPTTLPNPNELIINGLSYDGSEKKEIFITGSGDTVSWDTLPDKPDFADVAISGDYGDLDNTPSIDDTPTEDSDNSVSSGGVYDSLQNHYTKEEIDVSITTKRIKVGSLTIYESEKTDDDGETAIAGYIYTDRGNIYTTKGDIYSSDGDVYAHNGKVYAEEDIYSRNGNIEARNGTFYKGYGDEAVEVAYKDELSDVATSGDYSDLSNTPTIPKVEWVGTAADFNDYIEVGYYGLLTDIGGTALNAPESGYHNWALEVILKSSGYVIQRATRLGDDDVMITYLRELPKEEGGGDISSWNRVADVTYVDDKIGEIEIPEVDLSSYYTKTQTDSKFVQTTADMTIGGQKTFSISPIVPDAAYDNEATNKGYVDTQLATKVDKVEGKELSSNDFTDTLKTRLENTLSESEIEALIAIVQGELDTLVDGDTSSAIDTFNEIKEFLDGFTDTEDLSAVLLALKNEIIALIPSVPSWALESSKPSYDYSEINNTPTIPSVEGLATESYVDQKTAYATQTNKGTARIWTTIDDDGNYILNIATEDE